MSMPETTQDTKQNWDRPEYELVLVYSTFPSLEAAKSVARVLIEQRLAACVNIQPGMTAIYQWDGAVHEDQEAAVLIKTRRHLAERVCAETRLRHPYANPALIAISGAAAAPDYLAWVVSQTQPDPKVTGT